MNENVDDAERDLDSSHITKNCPKKKQKAKKKNEEGKAYVAEERRG